VPSRLAPNFWLQNSRSSSCSQAIADRSNSSIGALYNYFPDKQSIAVTLLSRYAEELQWRLKSLMEHSEKLSTAQFAGLFIDCIIEFAQERPAYLSLHTAPIRFRRDSAARKALRTIVANAFRTKNPSLSPERSLLAANVAVQIVKGMITVFLESDAKTKPLVVGEFRRCLPRIWKRLWPSLRRPDDDDPRSLLT
jgi:AcrR family transcriptional regulator